MIKPFNKIWSILLTTGPGIFCIGYTIGTGSVTSMAKAGSEFGMQLLWVLVLSVLFAWVLMEAYGRYAVVTGETAIHSFRKKIKYGKILAIVIVVGVVVGQWNSLTGILGLSANAIYELAHLFFPATAQENYWAVLGIAVFLIIVLYTLLLVGNYSFFEKILIVFVTFMGVSFLISMFIVLPSPGEIISGLKPSIPQVPGGKLMVAAFVGTTMAAPTFVVRPLLMKGKGWNKENTKEQSKDALTSAILMFVISASIMITATGALFHEGKTIEKVLDMVYTLEPVAGKFAVAIFMFGTLSAGLSSIFPILMVAPLLIADYRNGELDTNSKLFKILTAIAAVFGLIVPIIGANPIVAQIATQVANVFVLPLVIGAIIYLVNNKEMGRHKAGLLLNIGLVCAVIFSCFIAWNGINALLELL
ncbi:Nramp family divalent metal transporter [Maribellus maritimus]|uniref:Nramp family divalent metal transporter n=1 Tax=Maribellus maritimus TaxID=2870838 RepID=UPI001EEA360A|nr:Nramp family divalent metal transporter [Maribellus maritimus]MCG6190836.1 Nramp family divalent metal transporter [Maribellus maritimus]